MRRTALLLACSLLLAAGCGAGRQARRLEGRFRLGQPGEDWQRVLSGGADRAWYNSSLGATIYADSNCAARYEDGELKDLLTHLTSGIARGKALTEEHLDLDGREALVQTWKGTLDGVPVHMAAMVTKKDECLYDLVYIAPPASFERGWPAFQTVLGDFSTSGP